jgi:general secretion pathway protein G
MLVVVLIVGILASAAVPQAQLQIRRDKEAELRLALRKIRGAIDAYKAAADTGTIEKQPEDSGYPPNLRVLVDGVEIKGARDPGTGAVKRVYFLRSLPRDPFADAALPAEETWAPRCYDSPPDDPEPGPDVFDVHSRSPRIAIDSTPYSSW